MLSPLQIEMISLEIMTSTPGVKWDDIGNAVLLADTHDLTCFAVRSRPGVRQEIGHGSRRVAIAQV